MIEGKSRMTNSNWEEKFPPEMYLELFRSGFLHDYFLKKTLLSKLSVFYLSFPKLASDEPCLFSYILFQVQEVRHGSGSHSS